MFKNRHVVIAMFVAPLLALGAYFLTDFIVSEEAVAAVDGQAYPLVAKSNCRYQSGICTLANGEIELKVRITEAANGAQVLELKSNRDIDGVKMALLTDFYEGAPAALQKTNDGWTVALEQDKQDVQELRLAVKSDDVMFYASTSTEFFFLSKQYPEPNW